MNHITLAIVVVLIVLPLLIIIKAILSEKSEKKPEEHTEEEHFTEDESEFKVVGAVLLGKQHTLHSTRHHHFMEFKAMFMTDDGEKVELIVPQEIYEELYESQAGDLVTVNGNYFYFGDGEPIDSNKEKKGT